MTLTKTSMSQWPLTGQVSAKIRRLHRRRCVCCRPQTDGSSQDFPRAQQVPPGGRSVSELGSLKRADSEGRVPQNLWNAEFPQDDYIYSDDFPDCRKFVHQDLPGSLSKFRFLSRLAQKCPMTAGRIRSRLLLSAQALIASSRTA